MERRRGKGVCRPFGRTASLADAAGGALVDASAAVDALAGVDDSDVIDGQGALGADVCAGSASHALGSVDSNCHVCYLWVGDFADSYINATQMLLGKAKNP